MTEKYYEILGVEMNATLPEIKKAFRRKAKILHPDINKSPDAHEQFILLNEAYEYLQNLKTGKLYDQKRKRYSQPGSRFKSYTDWEQQEREKTRQRARHYAKMRYEAFTETDFYKTTSALNTLLDFISVLIALFILIAIPIFAYFTNGIIGLIGGVVVIVVTSPLWARVVMKGKSGLNFMEVAPALTHVVKTKTFQLVTGIALNLFLILRIGFNTLINLWTLGAIFGLCIALGYLVSLRLKNKFQKRLSFLVIAPGIVNLFLVLNFLFSTNETVETYSFTNVVQQSKKQQQKTTTIILEGGKYANFLGIRMFADYESMEHAKTITYHFADGLFGFRVMKSFEFK